MNTGLISGRYATALLDYALENNSADQVYDAAVAIVSIFSKMKEIRRALESPVLGKDEKRKLILAASGGDAGQVFDQFTDLLLKNKREAQIQYILLRYIDLYRKKNSIHHAVLTTASKLDEATEKNLVQLIEKDLGGKLQLEKRINPDVLGGFSLEMDHRLWDATLSGQLKRLRDAIKEENSRIV